MHTSSAQVKSSQVGRACIMLARARERTQERKRTHACRLAMQETTRQACQRGHLVHRQQPLGASECARLHQQSKPIKPRKQARERRTMCVSARPCVTATCSCLEDTRRPTSNKQQATNQERGQRTFTRIRSARQCKQHMLSRTTRVMHPVFCHYRTQAQLDAVVQLVEIQTRSCRRASAGHNVLVCVEADTCTSQCVGWDCRISSHRTD